MSTLRINNIEAKSVPASPTIDEKIKLTNSSGDVLVHVDGKTSGITTIGINTTAGNITFDANSNVVVTGIITATKFVGTIEPTNLTVSGDLTIPDKIIHSGDTNTAIRFPAADTITAETGGSERLRIGSNGEILTGGATSEPLYPAYTTARKVQAEIKGAIDVGQTRHHGSLAINCTNENATLHLIRSQANNTSGIDAGVIAFTVYDGTDFHQCARIMASRDATGGNNDTPGRLTFHTTADGASTATERLRITSGGNLRLNNADSIIHTSADSSRIRIFGGSSNSVNNGAALTLHGVSNSNGNYADLASGSGGHIQFRTGTSERLRIVSNGHVAIGNDITNDTGMFKVDAADGQSDDQYVGQFINREATASRNYGVNIQAGSNSTDHGFRVRNGANNATHFQIRGDGVVTKPAQPSFRVGRSTDITPGSQSTIVFNYVANPTHFNQGGHYNNSTGAFTAPVAGIYNFYCQVLWEGLSSGQNMDDAFYVMYNSSGGASGGTLVSYDARRAEYISNETGNAGYYGAHTSVMIPMAAGGSVYIRNNRGGLVVHGNKNFTFFQGYLIG